MGITVHLDYANWIRLSRNRAERELFEKALGNKHISPVLSSAFIFEIINTGIIAQSSIINFFDEINKIKPLKWLMSLHHIVKLEAKACYESWVRKNPVTISPFGNTMVDVLEGKLSNYNTSIIRTYTFKKMFSLIRENIDFSEHKEFRDSYSFNSLMISDNRRVHKQIRLTNDEKKRWLIDLLPKTIELSNGMIFPITQESKDAFYNEIDFSLCPAFNAKVAFYDGRHLCPDGMLPSGVEDHLHLVGIAYCDMSFVDNQTYYLLEKGNYKGKMPLKNAEFPRWLDSLN